MVNFGNRRHGEGAMTNSSDTEPKGSEQREYERFDVELEGGIARQESPFNHMMLANLSLGGCFVRSDTPQPPGADVKLRFKLPGMDDEILQTFGRVCWNSDEDTAGATGMGIQFAALDDDAQILLKRYIAGLLDSDFE